MNLKKFGIFSGIFIGIIIILSIVLSCVKTTTVLNISEPATIIVYDHDTIGKEYSKENFVTKYNELFDEIKNIGKLSILNRAINKIDVNDTLSQDIDQNYPKWEKDKNVKNNYCIELKFNTTQNQIVYIDGDSKRIDFKQLIFVVPEDGKTQEIAIYFMISSGAAYSTCPMLMNVNCSSLLKYLKTL